MKSLAAQRSKMPMAMTSACPWALRQSCWRKGQTHSGTSFRQNPSDGSGAKTSPLVPKLADNSRSTSTAGASRAHRTNGSEAFCDLVLEWNPVGWAMETVLDRHRLQPFLLLALTCKAIPSIISRYTNHIKLNRSTKTRNCMVLVFLFALAPSTAMADCDLLRKFNAVQSNGFNVVFDLSDVENGKATGSAHYFGGEDFRQVNGQADATFDGLSLTIDVHWENGSIGHYEGRIDGSGHLAGATKDLKLNPSGFQAKANWVHWESKQKFNCAQEAGASPSTIDARCSEYARTALQQNKETAALACGFAGARWDSNAANHENWCRGAAPDVAVSETAARAEALNDCRAQIALRGQSEKKPNIPIGDVTKPVNPPPSEPLPPAGAG